MPPRINEKPPQKSGLTGAPLTTVDLSRILCHELMAVPLVIADTNGQLRTGNKLVMIELLSSGTERPRVTPIAG